MRMCMKSLANRPLLIIAAGFMPILLLQVLTMRQDDAAFMSLIAATDGVFLLLTTLLALRLMRRPTTASPAAAANRPVQGCGSPACIAPFGNATAALGAMTTAFDSGRQATRAALDSTPELAAAMIDRVYRLMFGKSLADVFRNPCPELLVLPFSHADPEPCQTNASGRRRVQSSGGVQRAALPGHQVTLCRAITEKQQATAALHDSEQRLRLALA